MDKVIGACWLPTQEKAHVNTGPNGHFPHPHLRRPPTRSCPWWDHIGVVCMATPDTHLMLRFLKTAVTSVVPIHFFVPCT